MKNPLFSGIRGKGSFFFFTLKKIECCGKEKRCVLQVFYGNYRCVAKIDCKRNGRSCSRLDDAAGINALQVGGFDVLFWVPLLGEAGNYRMIGMIN